MEYKNHHIFEMTNTGMMDCEFRLNKLEALYICDIMTRELLEKAKNARNSGQFVSAEVYTRKHKKYENITRILTTKETKEINNV